MTHIPDSLRRAVIERANSCCEYCLVRAEETLFAHEVDHIIAEKHHGATELDNLCYACFKCNRYKGSDIASLDIETNAITPLYNPRRDRWSDHFRLKAAVIEPLTPVGRVTMYLLQLNSDARLVRRKELIGLGAYPCEHEL